MKKPWTKADGERLRSLILAHRPGASIRAVAKEAGIDHANLARVLRGEAPPSETTLNKLHAIGVPVGEVERGDEWDEGRALVYFDRPDCPAWEYAVATVLKWYRERKPAYPCFIWEQEFQRQGEELLRRVVFCQSYEQFIVNVILFFTLGGVTSPAAARGLLTELSDIPERHLRMWIENEVARDSKAKRLFFHAVLFTINPFWYAVEGGLLRIDPNLHSSQPDLLIQTPPFGIEEVKKFLQEREKARDG